MNYWLLKTEPTEYSIDDLQAEHRTRWDGIRNYQARNLIRDKIKKNDLALIYHSRCKPTALVGVARVITPAYADPTQFDPLSPYYDSKADEDQPRWFCMDIHFEERFLNTVNLQQVRQTKALAEMALLKQGRLSVQPVTEQEYRTIIALTDQA